MHRKSKITGIKSKKSSYNGWKIVRTLQTIKLTTWSINIKIEVRKRSCITKVWGFIKIILKIWQVERKRNKEGVKKIPIKASFIDIDYKFSIWRLPCYIKLKSLLIGKSIEKISIEIEAMAIVWGYCSKAIRKIVCTYIENEQIKNWRWKEKARI